MAKRSTAKKTGSKRNTPSPKDTSRVVDVKPDVDPLTYRDKPERKYSGNSNTVRNTSSRKSKRVHFH